ncbi:MAG: YihY/virulence factor BrkB family protein [Schaedlerella sp.]|nr:YihY/virulence factor BrkB family protein [Schaedlerella sp.]
MKRKRISISDQAIKVLEIVNSHHTGSYAAQSAYFFVLSMIPIIILLLTAVQYTPLTKEIVMDAVLQVFPSSVEGFMRSIVNQAYGQSTKIIPITALTALWSAGKGVMAITSGLNLVYANTESRNYLMLRIRASFYTLIFIVVIVFSLILSVFGNSISITLKEYVPMLDNVADLILELRTFPTLIVLIFFWDIVYKYLPDRTESGKTTLKRQLPGAVFTAFGWMIISFVFSIYMDVFTGFSVMYGSLTMLILILLWLYMCMYVILLGGEVNALLERYSRNIKEAIHHNNDQSSEE